MVMNEKNLYRFANALLLMFCVILCPMKLFVFDNMEEGVFGPGHYLAGCMIVVFVATWFQLNKKGRIILVTAVVLALGIVYKGVDFGESVPGKYVLVTVIALACCGFCLISEKIPCLEVIIAVGLLFVLAVDMFGGQKLTHLGVVCVLLYIAMVYVEWNEKLWEKKRLTNHRYYLFRILPFWLLYFGVMLVMPVSDEPYDWQFVKDIYSSVKETFLQISRNWLDADREDFGYAVTGFGEDGRIGGNISDSGKVVMMIQGQKSLKTNVYLTGKVFDSFDGRCWYATDESGEDDRQLDAFETLYAVNCLDGAGISNYIERTRLSIWYEDFRTGYLFTPLKTIQVQNVEEEDFYSTGGSYLFQEKQGYGRSYNTFFYQMNVDHPLVYELLENAREAAFENDEEVLKELQKGYFAKQKYSLTDLDSHRKHIYEQYNQQVELSDELRHWLGDVTAGADTDMEKLRAIETALQGMIYTKTPGELPDKVSSGEAFLDYFLLESRQGYCVHYATAFVLLARAEGIPARYVQGFCVPMNGTDKVAVTSDMAHAWPEVYAEKVGWIPFEPTPGYEEVRYTPWEMKEFGQGEDSRKNGMLSEAASEDVSEGDIEEGRKEASEEEITEILEEKETDFGGIMKVAGWILVWAIVVSGVVWQVDLVLRRRRYRNSCLQERFLFEVSGNMRMLSVLGYERKDYETLTELRARAWAVMEAEEVDDKPEFVFLELYEEYLYGEYDISEEKLGIVTMEKGYLLQMLKRWKPVFYWYFQLYYNFS